MRIVLLLSVLSLVAAAPTFNDVAELGDAAEVSDNSGKFGDYKVFDGCKKNGESPSLTTRVRSATTTGDSNPDGATSTAIGVRCCSADSSDPTIVSKDGSDQCLAGENAASAKTFYEALAACYGLSDTPYLCSKAQLETGNGCGTGCNYDQHYVWVKRNKAYVYDGCKKTGEDPSLTRLDASSTTTGGDSALAGATSTSIAVRCCASSDADAAVTSEDASNTCYGDGKTWEEAYKICKDDGKTLCTKHQLETTDGSGRGCGTGCNYDQHYVWTYSNNDDGDAP